MVEARKARAVGFNHVALEVGDIEEALAFYGRLFDFKLVPRDAVIVPPRFDRYQEVSTTINMRGVLRFFP